MESLIQTTCGNYLLGEITNRRFNNYWREVFSEDLSFEDKIELELAKDDIRHGRFATHEEIMDILRN